MLAVTASPSSPEPEAARYRVDEAASTCGFTLRATAHTVTGTGGRLAGEFDLRPEGPGRFALEGELRVPVASLTTGNRRRDEKMRTTSLAAAEHPLLVFRPDAATPMEGAPEAGEGAAWFTLTGQLEIRGVARAVAIPLQVRFVGERLVADGAFPVVLADHDIPDPSVFVLRVEKSAHATFHLEAEARPPGPSSP